MIFKGAGETGNSLTPAARRRALAWGAAIVTGVMAGPTVAGKMAELGQSASSSDQPATAHIDQTVMHHETFSDIAARITSDLHQGGDNVSLGEIEGDLHAQDPAGHQLPDTNHLMPGDHVEGNVPLDK